MPRTSKAMKATPPPTLVDAAGRPVATRKARVSAPQRSGETVTIANKLPYTMTLRLHRATVQHENVMGGGTREVKVYEPTGEQITINGAGHPINAAPGKPIVGGYALTQGVSADFWRNWLAQNPDHDAVKNRLLFAMERQSHAEGVAQEQASIWTGLEPMTRGPDARLPQVLPGSRR